MKAIAKGSASEKARGREAPRHAEPRPKSGPATVTPLTVPATNPAWDALALGSGARHAVSGADDSRDRASSPLPFTARTWLERAFSADLSDVRLQLAPEVTRSSGTLAATRGPDIFFSRPMSLDARPGREVLAHEIAHVVQQRRGGAGASPATTNVLEAEAANAADNVQAGRPASISSAAPWGSQQNFTTTKEGDTLPDSILVDWSERFQITFGTRTTGYGDVLMQYKFHYLGSFTGDASDLDFTIERDPGGPWVMGTPHSRRINAAITKFDSGSITVDVYGDGSVIHYLWHTIEWSDPLKRELHRFELDENGAWVGTRRLTSLGSSNVEFRPESGVVGKVAQPPVFKPDPNRAPQFPTGMLLDMVKGRLDALELPMSRATWALNIQLAHDMTTATQVGDDESLARNARRLLDLLTYLGPVMPMLGEMEKPEQYLGGLADIALGEVDRIRDLYEAAMLEAYTPPGETPSLTEADQAMAAFPDWIKFLYLRDDRGVKSLISQIPGLVEELRAARDLNGNRWGISANPQADEMVGLKWGDLGGDLENRRFLTEVEWRSERPDVLDSIQSLYAQVQHSIGLLTAMIWHEQLIPIHHELAESLINAGMEATWWGDRTKKASDYIDRLQILTWKLSGIKQIYGAGYDVRDKSDREVIEAALQDLKDLGGQLEVDLDDFQTRIKWINRIAFTAKLALIVAAAALTGGSAGSLAFAGLRAAGASVAMATAGELVVSGLVFTVVSRSGQKIMFGEVEGNFFVDWFWNTVTLGVLKGVNYGFDKVFKLGLDPVKAGQWRFVLGRTATSMIALHGLGEIQHLATTGELMSGDERTTAIFQNVALMAGLEAGRFITEPLEKRLTDTLVKKLEIDVKLAKRIKTLAGQRETLRKRLDVFRGEASVADIDKTINDIQQLWADELSLVNDGVNRKILNESEMATALSAYKAHIAGMQLRLSQLGIEAPGLDGSAFRPIRPGIVEYKPEGRAALEDFYKPNPADPSTAGKSLKESQQVPGALEGRLPNGELTYYIPEGVIPKNIATAADIVAARDAAVMAAKADPRAAEGLRRLNEGLKASAAAKGFSVRSVDAILGEVPVELIPEFLKAMADPGFTQQIGPELYNALAEKPHALEFAREYGAAAVIKIWRTYSREAFDTMLERAQTALETSESAAARKEFLDELLKGDKKAVDKLLDNVKPKPPRPAPVSKKTLGVDRQSNEWKEQRTKAEKFAADPDHNASWASKETLDLMADMLQIHQKAMYRRYDKWIGDQKAIEDLLNRFDEMAEEVAKADPQGLKGPWAKTIGNWRNSLRGAIGEAIGRPEGTPKFKGAFKGHDPVAPSTPDATIPDYAQLSPGGVEWVNIKSDILTAIDPGPRTGVYNEGTAAARAYREKANLEAGNLPVGEKYSIQFVRDPLLAKDPAIGKKTQDAMLDILFNEGSPIYRVKFGSREWITRESRTGGK